MKSELSFLLELFLSAEVPQPVKEKVADRIREVEEQLVSKPQQVVPRGIPLQQSDMAGTPQAASMLRIMEKNPDLIPAVPVTPAAAQALQARADLLRKGMTEKPEPGRSGPRKI